MVSVSTQIARGDDLVVFERMLKSVAFADEITIYNMERTDADAIKLFKKYKARVIEVKTPKVVEEIRGRQVREAEYPWVLVMDFDEVIPSALKQEILEVTKDPLATGTNGYFISRKNFSLGFALKHGGWGSDEVARLFHRASFLSWSAEIHSLPRITGEYGHLTHPMEHHKDASLAQMIAKTNRYSDIEAQQFLDGGLSPVTPLTLLRKSIMEFIRRYFFKLGLLDGRIGLFQSLYQGYSVFITYAKLYELQQINRNDQGKSK